MSPATAVAAALVALAAGSAGIAAVWTRAQVPSQCLADDAIVGTPKGEKLKGTTGDDVIFGGGGNDTIRGRGGNDVLCGRGGDDTIKGGGGVDTILGGGGNDTLKGGPGDDTLSGGPGFDTLFGGADTDSCDGESETDCEEPEPTASPSPSPSPTATPTPTGTPTTTPTPGPTGQNTAPVASNDSYAMDEDSSLNEAAPGVLGNDSDAEFEVLKATVQSLPSSGTLNLAQNGSFSYVPNPNFNGTDSFTYRAQDTTLSSPPATVTITVKPMPDEPVAVAQAVSTDEDVAKTVTLTGTDSDGAPPSIFKITALPNDGDLRDGTGLAGHLIVPGDLPYTLTGNTATYVPDPDDNGLDSFSFKANDGTADSAAVPVSITVTAINDAPTAVLLSNNSVDEELPSGATVGNLSATDVDAGDTHSFTLVSGAGDTDNTKFSIASGVLKTAQSLDFETQGPFSIRVRATDSGNLQREDQFSITLNDVNDAPVVAAKTFSLPENSSNGTAVGTATVTDQDAGQTHTWSITGGNALGAFAIDSGTGAITVADTSDLDFETTPQFVLTVRAEDNGSPAKADTDTVTVDLTNVNETPTDLVLTGTSVAENESTGTNVGNLTTTDPDAGDTHSYDLVAGSGDADNGKFQITGGALKTNQVFDYETQGPFSVRIRTKDAGNLERVEEFTISLTDVNDAPVLNDDTFNVDENSANGTAVGTKTATDEDSPAQTLTYSITGGNSSGAFAIDSSTGAITVADVTKLDYETVTQFVLTVLAADDGTPVRNDSGTMTIDVNNLNEVPVVNAATFSLAENSPNGTSVGSVTATDPDAGQTLTYSITGGNTGGAFQINSGSGEITVADANDVDFETNHPFSLTVRADDNGVPAKFGTNTVTVNLTGVNEAPTDISLSNTSLPENAVTDTIVGVITGTDPDAGDSAALTFSLVSGAGDTDNGRFNISPTNRLRSSEVFDKETQGPFSVRLRATDGGPLQYEEVFQISITDVNEAPSIGSATFGLPENSPNGTSVGSASATDPDAGQTLTYSITGGNTGGAFQINSSTGEITVADTNDLDFETLPSFALTVKATDDGSPALDDEDTITINLSDVNDAPVVNAATLSIAENSANGTSVGSATASDQDLPAQTLTYSITGGNGAGGFAINTASAAITVADSSVLDFEGTPSYSLTVRADDNGVPTKFGTNTVTVNLTNVNEKPAITAPGTVTANKVGPNNITGISISDPDAAGNAIQLTLEAANGTLLVNPGVAGGLVPADIQDNGTDAVSILASQAKINTTLGAPTGVVYTNDAGHLGTSDTLGLDTDDQGNTGSGGAKTDSKDVTIQFNAAPVANAATVSTNEDTSKTITLGATDAENDPLTFTITSLPASGGKLYEGTGTGGTEITTVPHTLPLALGLDKDKVTYVPPANQNGLSLETFGFKASDANNDSNGALITLDVSAVDDNPVAVNDPVTVLEDANTTTIDVLANDTDIDAGTKTIASKTDPTNGSVNITNGGADLTYKPVANYCNNPPTVPVDSFTYTLNGGSVGTVNVTVTCVDDLPVAVNDTKTLNEDAGATTIDVLANDTDQDAGPKTINLKTNGANGTVAITNSGVDLTYTPAANYCNNPPGTTLDTFTYTLNGGSVGTVTVTVECVDDPPVAVNDTKTVLEDAAATTINVLANDTDIDAGPKLVNAKTNSTNGGTVTITNSGADLTYTPVANYCNDPELQPAGGNLTETFTYTLNGGSIGTVTVTVTCVNDAPVADLDTLNGNKSALANTTLDNGVNSTELIQVDTASNENILAGDTDVEGDTISLIAGADCTGSAPFTCTTDQGGTVSLASNGLFEYKPPAGHTGTDSFDYRISDGEAQNAEDDGTVNINVVGPLVWYVDDTAPAGGNGTSSSMFQTLAPLTTGGASDSKDGTGDRIFVRSGNYPSGLVLENTQKLIGEPNGFALTDSLSRNHNLLAAGGSAPAISHAASTVVTLGSGNELQDLALGNGTITLAGTSVGTALVRDTSISTTGKALDVNGGTLDMVFSTLTSNGSSTEAIKLNNAAGSLTANGGTLQNAGNAVVDINGATQDVTLAGNISDVTGPVISITNTTGGTKDFNGTVTGGNSGAGTRINLTSNTNSIIRFDDDVSMSTGAFPAVNATGGGTLHMGSDDNVLTTTTGTPLTVANTTIGASDLIFDSISSSGAPNGIVLDTTGNTGNLNVTGTGPAASGGTIAGSTGADASTTSCGNPATPPTGVGIYLRNTTGPILQDVVVNGSSNFGLLGHSVSGFTMDDSTFSGTHGDNENQDEGAAYFCALTGTATVSDSSVTGGYENSFSVANAASTLNLGITNTSFATSTSAVANDALSTIGTGTATFNVNVNNSTFPTARGDLFDYTLGNTAAGDLQLTNSVFTNNHPSIVAGGGGVALGAGGASSNPTWTYNVANNDLSGARGSALTIVSGVGSGTYTGTVVGNDIGITGVTESGSFGSGHGIALTHQGTGVHKVQILNNTVRQYGDRGIDINAVDGSPTLRATITGNLVTEPGDAVTNFAGVRIAAGALGTDNTTMCIDMGSSTPALKNSLATSHAGNLRDISIRSGGGPVAWTFPNNGVPFANFAAVQSYLAARNDGNGAPVVGPESLSLSAVPTYLGTGTNCL